MENSSVSDYSLIDWGIEEVSKYVADDAVVDVEPQCEIASGVGERVYGYADLIAGEHIFDLKS